MELPASQRVSSSKRLTNAFSPGSLFRSSGFVSSTLAALSVLSMDLFILIRYWTKLIENVRSFLGFGIGVFFILFAYLEYMLTYRELHVYCQVAATPSEESKPSLAEMVAFAKKTIDRGMWAFLAAIFVMLIFVAYSSTHKCVN